MAPGGPPRALPFDVESPLQAASGATEVAPQPAQLPAEPVTFLGELAAEAAKRGHELPARSPDLAGRSSQFLIHDPRA